VLFRGLDLTGPEIAIESVCTNTGQNEMKVLKKESEAIMQIQFWEESLSEAVEYEEACRGGLNRRKVFTPRILYNILALSAEKYCMSLFYARKHMPECHSFHDMSRALSMLLGDKISSAILDKINALDIPMAAECSLEIFKPEPLDYDQVEEYLLTLDDLKALVNRELRPPGKSA